MAYELTTYAPTLPGVVDPVELARGLVDDFVAAIDTERGFDALPVLPTAPERALIQKRLDYLNVRLRPAQMSMTQEDDLMQALGALWLGFPALRNADLGAMSAAYIDVLRGQPLFAALGAIDDVRHGRLKGLDPDWPPTAARLYQRAEDVAGDDFVQRTRAQRVLAIGKVAITGSPEMRDKVAGLLQDYVGTRRAMLDEELRIGRDDVANKIMARKTGEQMILDEYHHLGIEPIRAKNGMLVTPSLARSAGKLPERRPDEDRR